MAAEAPGAAPARISAKQPTYLRQVYPEPGVTGLSDCSISIVFVHGLNPLNTKDHAMMTWTHKNGNFWPKTQLKSNAPEARILIYSYNSQVALDVSTSGIEDHAESLLDRLDGLRDEKVQQGIKRRPIIFVAHSLGGLVVKQALVHAKNNRAYESIREATHGLVFFAVPHQGGEGANLGTIASNLVASITGNAQNSLVESLKKNSYFTETQARLFKNQLEDFQIRTFVEGRKTKLKRFSIFRPVTSKIIVDAKSATLGLAGTREKVLKIDATHSGLCKFEGADDVYEPVGRNIGALYDEARIKAMAIALTAATAQASLPPAAQVSPPQAAQAPEEMPETAEIPAPTKFKPFSTVHRNSASHFTGRSEYIAKIESKFLSSRPNEQRLVLWGLEGVGKTELAMKYSEGLPTGYSTLWINASSRNALVRSFLQIAKMLHPFIKKGGESYDQLSVIRELLEDSKYGPWLMVLDGADDKDIFLEEKNGMPAIGDFIPKAPHGRVLITTTDSRIVGLGDGALIPIQNGINLSTLSLGHGVELLRNSVPDELHQGLGLSDQSKCERLAGLLDCLPIALGHASAQIRTDQITLDDYIGDYISMQRSMDFGNLGETPQAGFVTFELSYQRLLQNSDLSMKSPAARLLDLMAFFDSRCVSKTYLQRVFKDEIDSDHPFKLAIGRLLNLSLVHRNSELEEFWMLSIVQNWVYQRLSHEEKLQYIKIAKDAWTKTASDISSRTLANRREYDIQNLPSLALDRDRHYHYERQTDVPFRPLRLLGEGAFGEVVEVEKISGTFKGKKFARKKLKMRLGHHPEEIEREVTILRRLQHRHIIELVSTYDTEQTFAIIMLPVAECNLSDYMDQTQESNMPGNMLSPMTRWFGCLTEAIAYIHSHNIIMRDLKPGNILVSNLEVILTDFGTATLHDDFHDDWDITMGKISEDESPDRIARESLSITSSTVRSRHLRTYAYYVTSVYTAPDALFYRQDRRFSSLKMQDIFGLGCVFLEIVTVLLGESINEFVLYRRNDRGGYDYSSNMENLLRWIMYLSAKYDKTDERSGSCSGDGHGSSGKGFCTSCLAKNALQWCFLMLQPRSEDRCSAEDLIYRLSASHLTISCVHCKPKLFLHERFLDRIHIPKVLVTAALRSDNAITWTIANKTWIERGAPQIETQVQQIGAVN